jgi:hypothetical protein
MLLKIITAFFSAVYQLSIFFGRLIMFVTAVSTFAITLVGINGVGKIAMYTPDAERFQYYVLFVSFVGIVYSGRGILRKMQESAKEGR